jgi:hypothetical protein
MGRRLGGLDLDLIWFDLAIKMVRIKYILILLFCIFSHIHGCIRYV